MLNSTSHRIGTNALSSQVIVNQSTCDRKSSQTIVGVALRALSVVFDAILYIPLRVISGLNFLTRRVSQVFAKTLNERTQPQKQLQQAPYVVINPIHLSSPALKNANILQACDENKYLEVWKAVKVTPSIIIENTTIIAINNMVKRLKESRNKIEFPALNAWLENIAAERRIDL